MYVKQILASKNSIIHISRRNLQAGIISSNPFLKKYFSHDEGMRDVFAS